MAQSTRPRKPRTVRVEPVPFSPPAQPTNGPVFTWAVLQISPHDIKLPDFPIRKLRRSAIEKAKKKLQRLGPYKPVLIDHDGFAVTGEEMVLAARELGLATLPVLRHDKLTAAHLRAIRLADNTGLGDWKWDFQALAGEIAELNLLGYDGLDLGFDAAELDQILAPLTTGAGEDDQIVEPPRTPVTRPGDIWTVGPHRVGCLNSLNNEAMDLLLAGRIANACLMDGPFNVHIRGHVSGLGRRVHDEFAMASGEMSAEEFEQFNRQALAQASRLTKPGALIYSFMDWRSLHILTLAGLASSLEHVNTVAWVKNNAGMGSFYRSQHELVVVFKKPGGRSTNNIQLGKFGRNRSNVWQYPGANAFGRTRDDDLAAHATVKPVALLEDAIKDCTKRGEVVLDLFGGSGSLMLAAERCGRKAILSEIEARFVDVTLERMLQIFDIDAVHEASGLTYSQMKKQRDERRDVRN